MYLTRRPWPIFKALSLRPAYRQAIDGHIRIAETLNSLIQEVSKRIREMVEESPKAMLLTTMPGISYFSAF
ncbi:hypothetical protein [Candidatus Hakubella thermalkaliphila]|uniref:hypothetical protein n=1 Tax=Candidatus Hakubella thermalkaliphila TaxID=2754717 RepID=UPI0015949CCD|nr:hypothetical protein [Candidatus Hakubella thermalkaliphila]